MNTTASIRDNAYLLVRHRIPALPSSQHDLTYRFGCAWPVDGDGTNRGLLTIVHKHIHQFPEGIARSSERYLIAWSALHHENLFLHIDMHYPVGIYNQTLPHPHKRMLGVGELLADDVFQVSQLSGKEKFYAILQMCIRVIAVGHKVDQLIGRQIEHLARCMYHEFLFHCFMSFYSFSIVDIGSSVNCAVSLLTSERMLSMTC